MREIRSLGSVRGVPGNRHSYRDTLRDPENHRETCAQVSRPLVSYWILKEQLIQLTAGI